MYNPNNQNYLDYMPFRNLNNYEVEILFESCKRRIQKLMNDHSLIKFIKEQKLSKILQSDNYTNCEYFDEENFSCLSVQNDRLNIFAMNISSLPRHAGNLVNFIRILQAKFQIIILSEIGKRNLNLVEDIFNTTHHPMEFDPPKTNFKGGVGIFLSHEITDFERMPNMKIRKTCGCSECESESVVLNFTLSDQDYTVIGAYRHPNGKCIHFTNHLENTLDECEKNRTIIYAADTNIDLIKYKSAHSEQFLTTLLNKKFLPYITLPTRITSHSATCIDHIFIRFSESFSKKNLPDTTSGIFFCDITDHLPTFASVQLKRPIVDTVRPKIRLFGERNCKQFESYLKNANWDEMYQSPDHLFDKFLGLVKASFDKSFPLVTISRKRSKDKDWLTPGLKISIQHNHKLFRKKISNPTDHNISLYTQYNRILARCRDKIKNDYFSKKFTDKSNGAKNVFAALGPLINPEKHRKSNILNKLNIGGRFLTDKNRISDELNRFFCNIGEELQSKIPQNIENSFQNFLPDRNASSMFLRPVNYHDVLQEIKKLKTKKAPGPDGISNKIILFCPKIFAFHLTKIYNHYISIGEYPTALKIAKVIPIYKNKGPRGDPGNYRPISLLSVFNKLFERLICKQLLDFLDRYHIFYNFQYGFRKLHSTTLALIEITDTIRRLVDEKNVVFSLFIDFKKAFDTVDHTILLYKLNHYGVRGHANKFFKSYLSNRTQYTTVNGISSNSRRISCGVPQGSVLGPILFLIYINDLHRCVNQALTRLFADDTNMILHSKNPAILKRQALSQTKNLIKWCESNKLTINWDKTHFLLFHAKNKRITVDFNSLDIDGNIIKREFSTKYLGLHVDEMFTWKKHTDHIYKSLLKFYGIFNQVKCFVKKKIIRQLYFSYIHSRIKYGIEVYGSCAANFLARLQTIQNGLLKVILRLDRRYSTNKLHRKMRLLQVKDIYKVQIIQFANTCLRRKSIPYFNSYINLRVIPYDVRNLTLDTDYGRINIGLLSVKNTSSREYDRLPAALKDKGKFLNFKKHLASHFLTFYNED